MVPQNRRQFIEQVGRGMLVAGVGSTLVADLDLAPALAEENTNRLTFGEREPLVQLMEETPVEKFLPRMVEQIGRGTSLADLIAAAALANARKFGGEDYVGFHTLMALAPAFEMSRLMPAGRSALPVLKVLYRNASRIQASGGASGEVLQAIHAPAHEPASRETALRDSIRLKQGPALPERVFSTVADRTPQEIFDYVLTAVEDDTDVHRVVLPYRAWALLDLVGPEQAHTMLRQSVRYCVANEKNNNGRARTALAQTLDQYQLVGRPLGTRQADDAWLARMCETLLAASGEQGADAVGAALHEGIAPVSVAEAIVLTANQIVLRDPGRLPAMARPEKPAGSVHGDSVGVHASDAVNAWINISQIASGRHRAAALVLAGFEVARDSKHGAPGIPKADPRPLADDLHEVRASDPDVLLKQLDGAIREQAQGPACAIVHRYGEQGHAPKPVFDTLLKYATSEDGALHAEKYFQTVSQEFGRSRPAFRWRQLVALARVTASEYGRPAAGYKESCELLKLIG